MLRPRHPRLSLGLLLATASVATWHASTLAWRCDDAFISYRYAQNLVAGDGLVFNVGEAVEGYSNFLWTLLLAAAQLLGVSPEQSSVALGLLSYAAILGVLGWGSARAAGDGAWLPVGALCYAGVLHGRIFATSGLETSLFTALLTGGALALVEARGQRGYALAGLLAALGLLTRPEGGLLVLVGAGAALWAGRRAGAAFLGPVALLIGPWLLWKLSFYGDLLPNTWYAKGDAPARWADGLRYLGLFARTWPMVPVGLIAGVVLAARGGSRPSADPGWAGARGPLIALAIVVPYLVYVARLGGDFMFARFVLPVTPLLLFCLERALALLPRPASQRVIGLAAALSTALAPPPPEIGLGEDGEPSRYFGITEERNWYPPFWEREARRQGEVLREELADLPYKSAYFGTQAMLVYYSEAPYSIEPHVGLTDRAVAHRPPEQGARVGHGQKASLAYLAERGVDLLYDFRRSPALPAFARVELGSDTAITLLRWRPALVDALQQRGAVLVDFPTWLDGYLARLEDIGDDQFLRDYKLFKFYYFDLNDDPARLAPLEARAARL